MSTRRHPDSSTRRILRWLAPIPLVAALACADATDPVAPAARPLSPDSAPAAYTGVTGMEFSNVQVQSEGMGLSIKFDYAGSVIPAFTVGKDFYVYGTQIMSVPAKKQAAGYWTAHVGGLEPYKSYYFRIDNLTSTYYGSAKTLRRDIVFDLDSIHVIDDADWGPGCGEWDIKAQTNGWANSISGKYQPSYQLLSVDMCTGSTYRYTAPGSGVHTFTNMQEDGQLQFFIKEWDDCWPNPGSCTQQGYTLLYPFASKQSGTTKFDMTTVKGLAAQARFWGKISTTYVAW
jgi:hypothetical protein